MYLTLCQKIIYNLLLFSLQKRIFYIPLEDANTQAFFCSHSQGYYYLIHHSLTRTPPDIFRETRLDQRWNQVDLRTYYYPWKLELFYCIRIGLY